MERVRKILENQNIDSSSVGCTGGKDQNSRADGAATSTLTSSDNSAAQNSRASEEALAAMEKYMDEILLLNESVNLTAITDRDDFISKHFVDSLLCANMEEFTEATRIIDVGTGAGFPGVPLAIAFPEKEFVLIDSLNKRIKIINDLCSKTGIRNVTAIHGRAEELARRKDFREGFDLCVSRAVANMSTLSEYCLPFIKVGGSFIAYKGPDCKEEVEDASKAIETVGGGEVKILHPEFEDVEFEHTFVVVKKIKETPKAYPRKAGTPAKKPL